jgi:tripartite-type tricarboxylate transporter receptor subunit TctC
MRHQASVTRLRAAIAAAVITFTTSIGGTAVAQSAATYPERRVTFVVPYAAGGATDVVARLLASRLQEA